MARIAIVGSLNTDLVAVTPRLPAGGETLIGSRHFIAQGGKGANQAFAAARLGGDVAMVGRVGDDAYGVAMRDNLAGAGCHVDGVRIVPGASGVALILVSDVGENSIVVVPGANHAFSPADLVDDAAALQDARYLLLQLESPIETVSAAANLARRAGATVILDPAPATAELPPELLAQVDILTPNESEAAMLAGLPVGGALTVEAAAEVGRALRERGVGTVILKLGARGCLIVGEAVVLVAAPRMEAVDTTAAGDVLNAGLAVALAEGKPLVEAATFAVHAAALSVTRFGAQPSMPTRAEVDAFIAERAS